MCAFSARKSLLSKVVKPLHVAVKSALALKSDGSLWKVEFRNWAEPPRLRRLSAHSEWRAVAADINMLYALAADGSIWRWEAAEFRSGGFMAAPSRIPVRIGSVFEPSR